MPMHYGHRALQIVSQSSPTGTQFLQAVGTAVALKRLGAQQVVYVSAGEGTTAQGEYHEALNWAAREKLPIIFLIQDNKYAISVHISEQIAGGSVAKFSAGYEGLEVVEVDGLDYFASRDAAEIAVARAREGQGPSVIIADVVRLQSHSISDNQKKYRSAEDIEHDAQRDPILTAALQLIELGIVSENRIEEIGEEINREVNEAAEWAEQQADPLPESYDAFVYAENPRQFTAEPAATGEELFIVDALNRALVEEMAFNDDVIIYGQDVAKGKGGVFTVTSGLTEKFGLNRCFNSPLAEASILGTALGMSVVGLKPVVEIQFGDYVWTGMMQLRNEIAMLSYRSNGNFSCPLVVRMAVGGYIRGALYHSQNVESTFSHFPGLTVILPSNAADAKGLLKSAIRSPNPVLFLEHKGLYRQVYAKSKIGDGEALIPIGQAKVVISGSDATIVSWGALVHKSLLAAQAAEKEGYSVEVIDLRTIYPLDIETIIESVKKTSRLLIAHEDVAFMGFGAEIAAQVSEACFSHLDAPVRRVAGKETPIPHAPILEQEVLPQTEDVTTALLSLLRF
jgi:2-oxoisovalerate dehydrogenase E1 component